MNVQNENLLFTSACALFHWTMQHGTESLSSFPFIPQTLEAMKFCEEDLEIKISDLAFERWRKRPFRPVTWLSCCTLQSNSEILDDEGPNTALLLRDGRYYSLLDFCISFSESGAKMQKAIKRFQRQNLESMLTIERYLFVVEFQGMDIRYDCSTILLQLPEVECIAMGRYAKETFCGGGWMKEMLPANMYLLRMRDGIPLQR